MLEVNNVTKYYGDFLAVDNLSFKVKKGEIFGLLGVNGAGKTTTFRMIVGLLEASSGSILLNGKPIGYDITDKIGFLTEERSLLTKLTVLEQAIYYGTLKGMTKEKIINKLDELLDEFNISNYKNRKIKELSKGNQQKVQFIMAIINDPELLILDEPFSGLDPLNVELFMEFIKKLKKKGTIIIFSSHRMEHVETFCEKLVVLVNGKSVLSGELKQIKNDYKKKNIHIVVNDDNFDIASLKKVSGVKDVIKQETEIVVKIDKYEDVENVFEFIKKYKNVSKFLVEDATLNEIFLEKVGVLYES
jgi:ABC-2 type transport system ATP-binding protein